MPAYGSTPRTGPKRAMTPAEIIELATTTPTCNLKTLANALNISEPTALAAVKDGTLTTVWGIRVLRVGTSWRIPTSDICRSLGLELPPPAPVRKTRTRRAVAAAG